MTRGMTLIEVLISLALLTAVVSAAAAWTTIVGHATSTTLEPSRWRSAARNALQLIHDDILTGDFEPPKQPRENADPTVTTEDGTLSIRSRIASPDGVAKMRHYRLDAMTQTLTTTIETDLQEQRRLMTGVDEFSCAIDDEHTLLAVTIASTQFGSLSRSYTLP
jgi:prepilin-type N-terminal cleavage/methylation domain-containing protein